MSNVINIHGKEIIVKELDDQRVVTFDDIDRLHNRPSGTARKRANENQKHLIENEDYFNLTGEALSEFRTNLPEHEISKFTPKITLITESGYLMIVKSLTDDLAWKVQRELVNNYFRKTVQKPQTLEDLIILQAQSVKELKQKVERQQRQIETANHRLNNLDAVNLNGDLRQRLNKMIRKYAFSTGVNFNVAWNEFKKSFNTAYNTNVELLKTNHHKKTGREVSTPELLEIKGLLPDAVRIADKMLNQSA